MKKIIILLLTISSAMLISCSDSENRKIKKYVESVYDAEEIDGKWVKSDLNLKIESGFYSNGSQQYFIGFEGYGERYGDTTFIDYKKSGKPKQIEEGAYIYYYNGDSLLSVQKRANDTVFYYEAFNLKSPSSYTIYDSKNRESVMYDFYMDTKRTYLDWVQYDKKKGVFECLVLEERYPPSYKQKDMTDLEQNAYIVSNRKHSFIKYEYEYFD